MQEGLVWEAEERAETVIKKLRKEPLRRPYRGGNPNLPPKVEGEEEEEREENDDEDTGDDDDGDGDDDHHDSPNKHDTGRTGSGKGSGQGKGRGRGKSKERGRGGVKMAEGAFKAPKVPDFKELLADMGEEYVSESLKQKQKQQQHATQPLATTAIAAGGTDVGEGDGDGENALSLKPTAAATSATSASISVSVDKSAFDKFSFLQMEKSEGFALPLAHQRRLVGEARSSGSSGSSGIISKARPKSAPVSGYGGRKKQQFNVYVNM